MVQELQRHWQVAVEPFWERLRALSMADLAYRMDQFAGGGLVRVLDGLHPDVPSSAACSGSPSRITATTTST